MFYFTWLGVQCIVQNIVRGFYATWNKLAQLIHYTSPFFGGGGWDSVLACGRGTAITVAIESVSGFFRIGPLQMLTEAR